MEIEGAFRGENGVFVHGNFTIAWEEIKIMTIFSC
jgi:hypothetical protein